MKRLFYMLIVVLLVASCSTTGFTRSDISYNNVIVDFETYFYTNFRDTNADKFTVITPGNIEVIGNDTFLKSNKDGSFQRQYKLKRGSASLIKFKPIDDSGILFAITKDGYKNPGFQMVGLSFFGGDSIQAFEMHGENPIWTNQKWVNDGYKKGQIYELLMSIDDLGKLIFIIHQENGKDTIFKYPNLLENEMYSFAINFKYLQVYEYKELKRN